MIGRLIFCWLMAGALVLPGCVAPSTPAQIEDASDVGRACIRNGHNRSACEYACLRIYGNGGDLNDACEKAIYGTMMADRYRR